MAMVRSRKVRIAQNLLTVCNSQFESGEKTGRRRVGSEQCLHFMVMRKRIPLERREIQRENYLGRKSIIPSGFVKDRSTTQGGGTRFSGRD